MLYKNPSPVKVNRTSSPQRSIATDSTVRVAARPVFFPVEKAENSCRPQTSAAARRMASKSRERGSTYTYFLSNTQGASLFQTR